MILLGYLSALLMGFTLGLLGGGGSILSVPIFLYLYGFSALEATSFSLFVVGSSALIGFLKQLRLGNVDVKTGLIFAAPSMVSVLMVRRFLIPAIPTQIISFGSFEITRDLIIVLTFAGVMIFAGLKMIYGKDSTKEDKESFSTMQIASKGGLIGAVTGFVGAGGGFLIVPSLNIFFKLPIKRAMGTSLMIVSINSLLGFLGATHLVGEIPWQFLILFASIAIAGVFIGAFFNDKLDSKRLKRMFGYFVLAMATFMIFKSLIV